VWKPADGVQPVYVLVDESTNARPYIGELSDGVRGLLDALRQAPDVAPAIRLSVLGYADQVMTRLPLEAYPNAAPPVYRFLATQPRGIVAEFPVPQPDSLPGHDAEFAYMSTFHWFPLVNGYSGSYPPSYLGRIDRLRDFPDAASIDQLRRDAVRYVIVHSYHYHPQVWQTLARRLDASVDLIQLGRFDDGNAPAIVYRLR